MTPAARVAAAIEIIDQVVAGMPAEKALTNWARGSRFAGSKDRAAVRDHVFDVVRRWWSSAARGRGTDGRARMIGLLRETGPAPETLFTGQGYGPAPLSEAEQHAGDAPNGNVALDCPDWLAAHLEPALGDDFAPVMEAMRHRAPVWLRVNTLKSDRATAEARLAEEGIETEPSDLAPHALRVLSNPRRVQQSRAYLDGLVELQDVASQAVVEAIAISGAARILDLCAGGGGKTLALAARFRQKIYAHDIAPERMRDLPARATRAGANVEILDTLSLAAQTPFDCVVIDAPCSGSGAWRRDPSGKISFDYNKLEALVDVQSKLLNQAVSLTGDAGQIVYVTCSLLAEENEHQVATFAKSAPWNVARQRRFTPLDGGDGFFVASLNRKIN